MFDGFAVYTFNNPINYIISNLYKTLVIKKRRKCYHSEVLYFEGLHLLSQKFRCNFLLLYNLKFG